ncbi:Sodium channel modifier 1 [Basidiobolus ranarum]|uniref:Sodium channel modifier 1 n=1 Tax=Basidiobolus ranarum TaxID=34480 RepID=A0ABR2WT51_9FUNG
MFKLTGERSKAQNNLHTKRLTDELLVEKIPPNEAVLLANGKYKCLVCRWRPIIDDIKQLSVHRKGRKHRQEREDFLTKKSPSSQTSQETISPSLPLLSKTKEKMTKALLPGPRYNPFSTKRSEREDRQSIFQPQIPRQQPVVKKVVPAITATHDTHDYVFPWMMPSQKNPKQKQKPTLNNESLHVLPEEEHKIALEKYHLQLIQVS